jgi:phosphohistidine phosphatase
MNLYILRHGLAADRGASPSSKDADRPLTPKGKRKLWRIASAMENLDVSFDLILFSPCLRARQTAEIVAEAFESPKKLRLCEALAPDGSMKNLIRFLDRLRPSPKGVMLVGHEPYLSGLTSLLVSGESDFRITLKKGGVCKLSVESLRAGRCASLEWLLTPKQMSLIAAI